MIGEDGYLTGKQRVVGDGKCVKEPALYNDHRSRDMPDPDNKPEITPPPIPESHGEPPTVVVEASETEDASEDSDRSSHDDTTDPIPAHGLFTGLRCLNWLLLSLVMTPLVRVCLLYTSPSPRD